jgi:two-component system, NarL family, sensor kinase
MDERATATSVQAENRLLHRVIETITSKVELRDVLPAMVDLVLEATGGDACFLHLWEAERERLVLRAASEPFTDLVGKVNLRLGEGVSGWVAANREVVVIPEDKWADPRYKYIPELRGELFSSMLSVPVVSRSGALVGVFNVHARERREFGRREIEFLRFTALLIAEAIEHASLFRELADKEAALEGLVRRTIEAQEEERRRVAADIHDGVTQHLVSVWYRLQACGRSLRDDPERAWEDLVAARDLVDEALVEARAAIYDLRPSVLDDLGLAPSLRALAASQLDDDARLELLVDDTVALPPHHELALYRIAQEALTNVRRHAQASAVTVALRDAPDHVELLVSDDGIGFAQAQARSAAPRTSFGLTGIAERASLIGGRLIVRSAPGKGTALTVRIPKQERQAEQDRRRRP